jgi:hypothetical protein
VTVDELEEIITAVMICIGYKPDLHSPG